MTISIQTYYVLIHTSLVKSLALVWRYTAEHEELSADEKVAFWPLYHSGTHRKQYRSESEVTSQQPATVSQFNEVDRKTLTIRNSSVKAAALPSEENKTKKTKLNAAQTIKNIASIFPNPKSSVKMRAKTIVCRTPIKTTSYNFRLFQMRSNSLAQSCNINIKSSSNCFSFKCCCSELRE